MADFAESWPNGARAEMTSKSMPFDELFSIIEREALREGRPNVVPEQVLRWILDDVREPLRRIYETAAEPAAEPAVGPIPPTLHAVYTEMMIASARIHRAEFGPPPAARMSRSTARPDWLNVVQGGCAPP